jgi:hypothetical protein
MSFNISSNPNIVDGPRKRLPSKRVTENGDQLSNKKARTSNTAKTLTNTSFAQASETSAKSDISHQASVEDIPHILDLADDTGDRA